MILILRYSLFVNSYIPTYFVFKLKAHEINCKLPSTLNWKCKLSRKNDSKKLGIKIDKSKNSKTEILSSAIRLPNHA